MWGSAPGDTPHEFSIRDSTHNWICLAETAAVEHRFDLGAAGVELVCFVQQVVGEDGVPVAAVWVGESSDVDWLDGVADLVGEVRSLFGAAASRLS